MRIRIGKKYYIDILWDRLLNYVPLLCIEAFLYKGKVDELSLSMLYLNVSISRRHNNGV